MASPSSGPAVKPGCTADQTPTTAPGPAPGEPLRWQTARVVAVHPETPRAKTFRLALPHRTPHLAGQYFILRLTAPDGYTASRAYSLSSPPEGPDGSTVIDLTVELLDGGEVSVYLHEVVEPGDELDVRGPIGGFFAWRGDGPVLLVAGGSGIVPLMAMLRLARRAGHPDLVRVLVSVRSPADLYFADELPGPETTVVYTRTSPPGFARPAGRLSPADVAPLVRDGETVFVCGSAGFADTATDLLLAAGVPTASIRVERFGPSG
jgi:ferredoxin-NADP reductase